MPNLALIGLGSNLGDRKALLDGAVMALAEAPGITTLGVSTYRETPPVGGPAGQGPFLNAAAALLTTLAPEELLDVLASIEARAGRARVIRWGERTLDLDLLIHGDRVINTPRLRVPHPRMAFRRFVLAPLAEVAPDAIDPVSGRSVSNLLANLDRRPSYVALASVPQLNWQKLDSADTAVGPDLVDATRFFSGEGAALHAALCLELPATALENRIAAIIRRDVTSPLLTQLAIGRTDELASKLPSLAAGWLDREACTALVPNDGWIVSHFWFDALFLGLDTLKTLRPRFRPFVERFLETRALALPPTFVIARPRDVQEFGIQDSRYAWRRPVGWDAPVVLVDDFESEASLKVVLDACSSTRAG